MLVLSRKLKEKIVLPTLNIAVQVVEIRRGVVRLGIEAPPEVPVWREEVQTRAAEWGAGVSRAEDGPADEVSRGKVLRQVCDQLNTTGLGLGLLRLQMEAGWTEEAKETLARLQHDFQVLRYGVEGEMENPATKPPARARKPQKALLVEDNHNERELLAGFLRQSGVNVDTAGDGSDALDYLSSHDKPDVILLDMGLPRVDGATMVREVRRNPAFDGLKIFGVTGHLPEEFNLEWGPRGIDRWFQKPLDPAALLHELTEELDGSLLSV